ncbi:CD109 antigen [Octopus bimaculoides]|uniref:CD109 antigen n=1 Tax=Octopus bimaculoides TaxID=37653 RepID=UPI0022E57F8F|nr:CD109 antigen [Octopus bimaculoides]
MDSKIDHSPFGLYNKVNDLEDIGIASASNEMRIAYALDPNLRPVEASRRLKGKGQRTKPRTNFVETWMWDSVDVGSTGTASLVKTAPDTITTWVTTLFGMHPSEGFISYKKEVELTTFQDFYIALGIPYSIVRGELFDLNIYVFNYIPKNDALSISCFIYRLTAYVIKCFCKAKHQMKGVTIDSKVIERAVSWLLEQQQKDGSFKEVGNVIHKGMQGGTSSGVTLTAFVTISFLQCQELNVVNVTYSLKRPAEYLRTWVNNRRAKDLPSSTKYVKVEVTGNGYVLVQVNWQYNLIPEEKKSYLSINMSKRLSLPETAEYDACVKYTGKEDTGMVLVSINTLSGFTANSVDQSSNSLIKRSEVEDNKVVVYLDSLPNGKQSCFPVKMDLDINVENMKPQVAEVVMYYQPDQKAETTYSISDLITERSKMSPLIGPPLPSLPPPVRPPFDRFPEIN